MLQNLKPANLDLLPWSLPALYPNCTHPPPPQYWSCCLSSTLSVLSLSAQLLSLSVLSLICTAASLSFLYHSAPVLTAGLFTVLESGSFLSLETTIVTFLNQININTFMVELFSSCALNLTSYHKIISHRIIRSVLNRFSSFSTHILE